MRAGSRQQAAGSRLAIVTVWLGVLLSSAAPAAAQDRLDHRVSLDLKAMAPRDAFNVIGTAIRYTVDVAPDVTTPVDIVVVNVRAKTALDTICDSIACSWEARGTVIHVRKQAPSGPVVHAGRVQGPSQAHVADQPPAAEWKRRLEQPLPSDLKFERAPLREVGERLGSASGLQISFLDYGARRARLQEVEAGERKLADARARLSPKHPDVIRLERMVESAKKAARSELPAAEGTITAELGNQPLRAALAVIGEQLGTDVACRLMVPGQPGLGGVALSIGKSRKSAR